MVAAREAVCGRCGGALAWFAQVGGWRHTAPPPGVAPHMPVLGRPVTREEWAGIRERWAGSRPVKGGAAADVFEPVVVEERVEVDPSELPRSARLFAVAAQGAGAGRVSAFRSRAVAVAGGPVEEFFQVKAVFPGGGCAGAWTGGKWKTGWVRVGDVLCVGGYRKIVGVLKGVGDGQGALEGFDQEGASTGGLGEVTRGHSAS